MKRLYVVILLLLGVLAVNIVDVYAYDSDYSSYDWATGFVVDGSTGVIENNNNYVISALKPIRNGILGFRSNAFHYLMLYNNGSYIGYVRSSTYTSTVDIVDDKEDFNVTPTNLFHDNISYTHFRVVIRINGTGYDSLTDLHTLSVFTPESFESIVRLYTVVPDTPPSSNTIDDGLNGFLDTIGLNNGFGKLFLSLFIILIMAVIIFMAFGKINSVLIVSVALIGLFAFIGWIQSWLLITVLILTVTFILIKSRSGGGSDVDD